MNPSTWTPNPVDAAAFVPSTCTVTQCCVPAPALLLTHTTCAGCTVGAYRSTVVCAPPSSWIVARPMSGPLVAITAALPATVKVVLLSCTFEPFPVLEWTAPPNAPARAGVVHVPPYFMAVVLLSSLGVGR